MTYVQQGKFTFTQDNLNKELTILRSVRHHLVSKYNVDPRRTYVSGFSKGGWISGLLLQADPELAGAVILGAGHVHKVQAKPYKFGKRTPVFIGVGRQDGNYPFALSAVTFYRGLGATTTLDTWHDVGHSFPKPDSPALTQWLAIERDPEADHTAAAVKWSTERLADIKSIPDPVKRWVAVQDMLTYPYYGFLTEDQKAPIIAARTALEKLPAVAPEAKTLAAHRQLLRAELSERSKPNYEKLLGAYLDLANSAPDTRQGDIARHDHYRIKTLLKHFDEQEKMRQQELEPLGPEPEDNPFDPNKDNTPNDRRRIPINPLVR
jgi:dienelactone hydrolase